MEGTTQSRTKRAGADPPLSFFIGISLYSHSLCYSFSIRGNILLGELGKISGIGASMDNA
jgi:hypothetical protein